MWFCVNSLAFNFRLFHFLTISSLQTENTCMCASSRDVFFKKSLLYVRIFNIPRPEFSNLLHLVDEECARNVYVVGG